MLNPKQEQFCIEYSASGNATSAYKKIYGVKDTATAQSASSRLLADERIQKYLRDLSEGLKAETIADVRELQEGLTKIFRGEIINVPVSVKDKLKAAEILCKTHGAFISKQELSISESVPVIIHDDI